MNIDDSARWAAWALGAAALALIGPVAAHHSSTMWDEQRTVQLVGTITKFEWTNPHAWIWLTAGQNGQEQWGIEAGALNSMQRQGWTRTSLKSGDRVTITVHPRKDDRVFNGALTGAIVAVKLADGTPVPATAPAGSF